MERLKNKQLMIETKSNSKIFGILKNIDNSPEYFNWLILIDKYDKEQIISDAEIVRIEVLE
jgi:hypothetical protein